MIVGPALTKLSSLASKALDGVVPGDLPAHPRTTELIALLRLRNGFYAFESALHVFPAVELAGWNAAELWRNLYGDLVPSDCVFFAEDLFGNQFGLVPKGVVSFDAESGQSIPFAESLEAWAAGVLKDHRVVTGWPLAHEWQTRHGALPAGSRLVAKRPFVLGGAYEVANLYMAEAATAMRARGPLAQQIAHLPEGAQIQFKIVD